MMEIVMEHGNGRRFDELEIGDVFIVDGGGVYMKLRPAKGFNAVSLCSKEMSHVGDAVRTVAYEARLTLIKAVKG